MGGGNDDAALGTVGGECGAEAFDGGGVQPQGRLVQEPDRGLCEQEAGEGEAAFLAGAEQAGGGVGRGG